MTAASDPCRLGVLAFGDSITNGGGELQWGVALQSWAQWVARGLGLPYSPFPVDGATAVGVTRQQIPAFRATAGRPEARYDLGCVYVGANDVRQPDWDAERYRLELGAALGFLAERCDRRLTATVPLDLARPRVGAERVEECNAVIEEEARRHGALVLDLRGFGARNLIMTDHVHPTAFGQIAIAERALDLLAGDGMRVRTRPSQLIVWSPSRRERLLGDWTYAYRALKVAGRSALLRARG